MLTKNKNQHFSRGACIGFAVFFCSFTLYLVCRGSENLANFINSTASFAIRFLAASLTSRIPFSVYGAFVLLLPFGIAVLLLFAIFRLKNSGRLFRSLINLLSASLLFYSGHLLAVGIAYHTTPINQIMSLEQIEITDEALAAVTTYLRDEVNTLSDRILQSRTAQADRPSSAQSVSLNSGLFTPSGLTLAEISSEICSLYSDFAEEFSVPKAFSSRLKAFPNPTNPTVFSAAGKYTFYTGEAAVNTVYPDFDIVFTAAHEMAHQRGILREDEANFAAYIMLSSSENEFFNYSAALSMYGYLGSALYKTAPQRYYEISEGLNEMPRADLSASNEVTKAVNSKAHSRLSRSLNDLLLRGRGANGTQSYGMVTRLAVSYLIPKI